MAINVVFSMCFSNVAGRGDELLTVAGSPQSMPHGHVSSFHMLFSGAAGNGNALLTVTWSQTEPATWQKKFSVPYYFPLQLVTVPPDGDWSWTEPTSWP